MLSALLDPWLVLVVLAHVVWIGGGLLSFRWAARRHERARVERLVRDVRCTIGGVRPGRCAVRGRFIVVAPGRAVMTDAGSALVVEYNAQQAIPEAPELIVEGRVDGVTDDPRAVGFHEPAQLPRLVVDRTGIIGTVDIARAPNEFTTGVAFVSAVVALCSALALFIKVGPFLIFVLFCAFGGTIGIPH